ncbi:hypothetical protein [Niveibacterium terrae]|uniref:hypothetical protein n=1 Tax=Niveibacterium terrae TaxID=3373598 RepID=UPI003A9374B7
MNKTLALVLACASLLGASPAFAHDHDYDRAYDRGWHDRASGRDYDRHWDRDDDHRWRHDWREARYLPPPPPLRFEERGYRYRDPRWVGVPVVEAVPVPVYPRPAITISLPSIVIPVR